MMWAWIIALIVCVVAIGILMNKMEENEKNDDKPNGPFLHGPFDPGGFYTD